MAEFESWNSYSRFASSIRFEARYVFDTTTQTFLETVLETCYSRKEDLRQGAVLWRAQLGKNLETIQQGEDEFDAPAPYKKERMKPLRHSACEGRVNPKGIPCLYLCSHRDTAMSEVRPWLGSYVSVVQFKTVRDLLLVDCSRDLKKSALFCEFEPMAEKREEIVWGHIARAFSQPVTLNDANADYAPTQILAETFRRKGYDGIAYNYLIWTRPNQ